MFKYFDLLCLVITFMVTQVSAQETTMQPQSTFNFTISTGNSTYITQTVLSITNASTISLSSTNFTTTLSLKNTILQPNTTTQITMGFSETSTQSSLPSVTPINSTITASSLTPRASSLPAVTPEKVTITTSSQTPSTSSLLTTTVAPKITFDVVVRFTNETWIEEYSNSSSLQFKRKSKELEDQIRASLKSLNVSEVTVTGLRNGSVIADTITIFNQPTIAARVTEAINSVPAMIATNVAEVTTTSTRSTTMTSTSSTTMTSTSSTTTTSTPILITTEAPKKTHYLSIRFIKEVWILAYNNASSVEYQNKSSELAQKIKDSLSNLSVTDVTVITMWSGSINTNSTINFASPVYPNDVKKAIISDTTMSIIDQLQSSTTTTHAPVLETYAAVLIAIVCFIALVGIIIIIIVVVHRHRLHQKYRKYGRDNTGVERGYKHTTRTTTVK